MGLDQLNPKNWNWSKPEPGPEVPPGWTPLTGDEAEKAKAEAEAAMGLARQTYQDERGGGGETPMQATQRQITAMASKIAAQRQQSEADIEAKKADFRGVIGRTASQLAELQRQKAETQAQGQPFGRVREAVIAQMENAANRGEVSNVPLNEQEQQIAESSQAMMRNLATQIAPPQAAANLQQIPPTKTTEIPITKYPDPGQLERWRQVAAEMPQTESKDRLLSAIEQLDAPAVLEKYQKAMAEANQVGEDPATTSAMDKMNQLSQIEEEARTAAETGDIPQELYDRYQAIQFAPEEKAALERLGNLLPDLQDMERQLNQFIGGYGNNTANIPLGKNYLPVWPEGVKPDYSAEDKLKELQGKSYTEIYGSNESFEDTARKARTTDEIMRYYDPRYAAFAGAMDALHGPMEPLPSDAQLAIKSIQSGIQTFENKASVIPGVSQLLAIAKPLFNYVVKPAVIGIAGALALISQIPEDLIGVVVSGWKFIINERQETKDEWEARLIQLSKDVYAPTGVGWDQTPEGGVDWKAGLSVQHIPKGRWELPEEQWKKGFSFTENPWIDMAIQTALSWPLQAAVSGLTQAGELRQMGMWDKLENAAPGLGGAIWDAIKSPGAATYQRARQIFEQSGTYQKVMREAKDAAAAGGISDWTKPTAKILASTTDERQLAKLFAKGVPSTMDDPAMLDSLMQKARNIASLTPAERETEWGKTLTNLISSKGAVPIKPGVVTRFPTMHPEAYKQFQDALDLPINSPLRKAYAAAHPYPIRKLDLRTAEAPEAVYNYLLNMGVRHEAADLLTKRLINAPMEGKGLVARQIDSYLGGKRFIGISRNQTADEMLGNLSKNIPMLDAHQVRAYIPELERLSAKEHSLYTSIMGDLRGSLADESWGKYLKPNAEYLNIKGSTKLVDRQYGNVVKYLADHNVIDKAQAASYAKDLKAMAKDKQELISRMKGNAGKLTPVRMGWGGKAGLYQAKVQEYGQLKLQVPTADGKTIEKVIHVTTPMTEGQLSSIYRFKHSAVNEIYRFNKGEMDTFLSVKDFGRKAASEINATLSRATTLWKRFFIYDRPSFVAKTYVSGQFKNLLMGTIDPSDMKAYNELLDKGEVVLEHGQAIKLAPETQNIVNNGLGRVLTEPGAWRKEYTGSWLFADSMDDPNQAVRNFTNQFLNQESVRILIKKGDAEFLRWTDTPAGQHILAGWKPLLDTGQNADRAKDYLASLKAMLKGVEDSAPNTYKAMLHRAKLLEYPRDLPPVFQKILKKKAQLSQYDIVNYLTKQGVKEHFGVPMTKHPYYSAKKVAPKNIPGAAKSHPLSAAGMNIDVGVTANAMKPLPGRALKWLKNDSERLYNGVFMRGIKSPRQEMYKSAVMDYGKQLMGQGLDADTAFTTATSYAARMTNDICMDFTRKLAMERKLSYMAPFLTATRLSTESWGRMVATRPGLVGILGKYFATANRENQDLSGFLRYTMPLTIGGRVYHINVPMIALMPWSYSVPNPESDSQFNDVLRSVTGPIPRMGLAELQAHGARQKIQDITNQITALEQKKAQNGYLADSETAQLTKLNRDLESEQYNVGGWSQEASGALLGIPTAWSKGSMKGSLRTKIDLIPESERTSGWTEKLFKQLSVEDQALITSGMNRYRVGKNDYDQDAAFLYAVDQLPGVGKGIMAPISAVVGRWAKPPATVEPKLYDTVAEKKYAAEQAGTYLPTGTPFWPEEKRRYTPYEWNRVQAQQALGQAAKGVTEPFRQAYGLKATAKPEGILTPEMQALKDRGQSLWPLFGEQAAWSKQQEKLHDKQAKLMMLGNAEPAVKKALLSMGYTEKGDISEQLGLYRQYQKAQTAGDNSSWIEYLDKKKDDKEYKHSVAGQDKLDTFKSFYPYGIYTANQATPTSEMYSGKIAELRAEFCSNGYLLAQLRDTLKHESGAAKAAIQAQIDQLTARNKEIGETPEVVKDLQLTIHPMEQFNLFNQFSPIPMPFQIPNIPLTVTTAQLAPQAGLAPPEERKMPTPPEEKILKMTPEEKTNYVNDVTQITNQTTWGKTTIEVSIETAMDITGMTAEEVRHNNEDKGLGTPRFDPRTGKVYMSSMPIDWLDKPTQDLLKASVNEATWAKIEANKSKPSKGGGKGWVNYGGYKKWSKYGASYSKGFTKAPSAGPKDAQGQSKMDVFYALPKQERTTYLDANPDLQAYFRRKKYGETDQDYQQRMMMMGLADRYYRLPPESRREFMKTHPELTAYFETLRQNRDKYFMSAMAKAFVNSPELWDKYINAQLKLTDELVAHMAYTGSVTQPKEEKKKLS